ncbi:sensor histidine kinase [Reinekea marinisedimentorum]|nr:sensor histidine kinase [Reinekea marinisedimentorum]
MIYFVNNSAISEETRTHAETTTKKLATETETRLTEAEDSLYILNQVAPLLDIQAFAEIIDGAILDHELIRAIYVLNPQGMTVAIGTKDKRTALHNDYIGIDFSNTPLYQNLQHRHNQFIWSDLFVSVLSGDTSVGVGIKTNEYAVIAELSLQSILETLISVNDESGRLWVIDGRGELLADTRNTDEAGILNVRTVQFMSDAVADKPLDDVVYYDNRPYHAAYAKSEKLGWMFLWGTPSGLHNAKVQNLIYYILLLTTSFLFFAFVLSPFWIKRISSNVIKLRKQAEAIAHNESNIETINSKVSEFQELSQYMLEMNSNIRAREDELRELNRSLEKKVDQRTNELSKKNHDLTRSMEDLHTLQEALVQSEKLASLGGLVAGVAHELNTPIGNAITSLSSQISETKSLRAKIQNGMTKSDLNQYLDFTDLSSDISYRNVKRAAELVTSFKHVANDQTSSIRRDFDLKNVVNDVLLTLHPMTKRTSHRVDVKIEDGIIMNSYPGVIVQILTNLITNTFTHAWLKNEGGLLVISAKTIKPPMYEHSSQWIQISVKDNGVGIPAEFGNRVFDPFFTSKSGLGGTGLGLNIAINGARQILGGTLKYRSEPDQGCEFLLSVPLKAPDYS